MHTPVRQFTSPAQLSAGSARRSGNGSMLAAIGVLVE